MKDDLTPGTVVVQPRMGFSDISQMREGLRAVRDCGVPAVGTITLDSFTRTNQHASAAEALAAGRALNGYPLVAHGAERTRELVDSVAQDKFPIQVRHGSARPLDIFSVMLESGITSSEGGPVSYCLPYGRVPLHASVEEWSRATQLLAENQDDGAVHLESFGGCMLGQLCPPDLLVALTILEGMFFREHGLTEVSLSYAQQINFGQDLEALSALRSLAQTYLSDVDWHVVVYTYMGVYPETRAGAAELLAESARLVQASGSERLVVKTTVEASRIPTIAENVDALCSAHGAAHDLGDDARIVRQSGILERADMLVSTVLNMRATVGQALLAAFSSGALDVPYCLHPDNANRARSGIDKHGHLVWTNPGAMPIARLLDPTHAVPTRAADLLEMLSFVRRRFDGLADGQPGACEPSVGGLG